jgi:hypothetical protein
MFTFMPIFISIFFIIVVGIIVFILFKSIQQWSKNNKQPRLNVNAVVVSKRTDVRGGGPDHSSSTWYHVTFQVESGDRMEFSVSGKEYG